jgi:hypothetical protein
MSRLLHMFSIFSSSVSDKTKNYRARASVCVCVCVGVCVRYERHADFGVGRHIYLSYRILEKRGEFGNIDVTVEAKKLNVIKCGPSRVHDVINTARIIYK